MTATKRATTTAMTKAKSESCATEGRIRYNEMLSVFSEDETEEEPFYAQPPKLAYREFFHLLLTCLKGHDEQRDILLTSLHKQLAHFVRGSQDVSRKRKRRQRKRC